ncbi:MAG: hypothetical protein KJO07_15070 [Deltaproteobacteria bacterium]|nr:hypothetical protein [Deltaproteobacteria bacterium]
MESSALLASASTSWLSTIVLWIAAPVVIAGVFAAILTVRRRRLSEGQRIVVATVGGVNLLQAGALLVAGLSWPVAVVGAIAGLVCVQAR